MNCLAKSIGDQEKFLVGIRRAKCLFGGNP